jgi:hypothetical protein
MNTITETKATPSPESTEPKPETAPPSDGKPSSGEPKPERTRRPTIDPTVLSSVAKSVHFARKKHPKMDLDRLIASTERLLAEFKEAKREPHRRSVAASIAAGMIRFMQEPSAEPPPPWPKP